MFNFQLYKACPLPEVKREKPKSLLGNRTREQLQKNPTPNFEEMVKTLKDQSLLSSSKNVTIVVGEAQKNPVNVHESLTKEKPSDLDSLQLNFTKESRFKRPKRARSSFRELPSRKKLNITSVSTGSVFSFTGANKPTYEEPDMDYYSDVSVFVFLIWCIQLIFG
jgi:hypothetical protein